MNREPVILDTTIRDGSYAVNFQYNAEDLRTIIGELDGAGMPYIEVGHGVTIGATNAWVTPKASWYLNYYGGPENATTTKGYRHLFDSTLLLTPTAKFSAYINYDYGQNRDALVAQGDTKLNHWQGVAGAAKIQATGTQAFAGRFEYFSDPQSFETLSPSLGTHFYEFTVTYEYKWAAGLVSRMEYRRDWSNVAYFHKNDTTMVDAQSTASASLIAFFGPKR